jgi:hypothetical protein
MDYLFLYVDITNHSGAANTRSCMQGVITTSLVNPVAPHPNIPCFVNASASAGYTLCVVHIETYRMPKKCLNPALLVNKFSNSLQGLKTPKKNSLNAFK